MSLTINTNIPSLEAQITVNNNQNAMNQSLQRLSSGLRINSAKDDAAGMAIASRFTSQVTGLNQAVRNSNDGISMLQTAEGSMQQVTTLLQSMRTLAVQASNDTNSASDRASIQAEMDQLYAEIDRIAGSTSFNGVNLLDGSGGSKSFQVGANAGQTITVQLVSVKTKDLNLNGYSALGSLNSGRVGTGAVGAALTLNGVAISATGVTDAQSEAAAVNLQTGASGVSAIAYNTYRGQGGGSGIVTGLTINGNSIAASGNMTDLVSNINRDASGVTATLNSDGSITLSNDTGKDIAISGAVTNSGLVAGTYKGYVSLSNATSTPIAVTTNTTSAALNAWGFNISTGASNVTGGNILTSAVALASGDLVINGVNVGASTGASAGDKAAAINNVSAQTGVTASASTTQAYNLNFAVMTGATASNFTINGTGVDLSGATNLNAVISDINAVVKGVVASADTTGHLVLTSASGLDITVADTAAAVGGNSMVRGDIVLTSTNGADVKISGNNVASAGFTQQGGSSEAVGSGLSVSNLANANNAITRIDAAINMVSQIRGNFGAVQNRLDSTVSNLQNISLNLSTANSQIMDADFASETAQFSKTQILVQAGVAMLAQAKQLPQEVMQLLK